MEITHYGHACVLLQTGDTRILVDPGAYSPGFEGLWRPRVAVPIHERSLANTGMAYGILPRLAPEGTTFAPLATGTATAF
jgi:hypothetical protein